MRRKFTGNLIFCGLMVLVLAGMFACRDRVPDVQWNYSSSQVVREVPSQGDTIDIDIYLDATKSMLGFIANSNSNYNQFLEELETTAGVGWRDADVRFFKFGTRIKEIDRDGYRAAKYRQFYIEPGIFEKTNIDEVLNQTDISRVSVVITDLFQDEGDINSIVQQIKDRCFKQGIQVAILGVKSDFDGWVYDVGPGKPPYQLKTGQNDVDKYRPFYALMFGDPLNIERLFDNLNSRPFVREDNFLVLSRHIINGFKIKAGKSRESRGLNVQATSKDEPENLFKFVLKKENDEGLVEAEIELDRNSRTPDFAADRMELVVYKKTATGTDSVLVNDDLELNSVQRDGDRLQLTLKLELDDPVGKYGYLVYLQAAAIGGLAVPQWVTDFSSANPSRNVDANKTLNLEKFVTDLLRASLAIHQPRIAQMYLSVRKL